MSTLGSGSAIVSVVTIITCSALSTLCSCISSGTLSTLRLPSNVTVSSVTANGFGLSSINAANIVGNLDLDLLIQPGSIDAGTDLGGTLAANLFPSDLAISGNVQAAFFSGNGAYLTGVASSNASSLTEGTLDTLRLPSSVVVDRVAGNGFGFVFVPRKDMEFRGQNSEKKPWKTIRSAGQGICMVDRVKSASDLIGELRTQYAACAQGL